MNKNTPLKRTGILLTSALLFTNPAKVFSQATGANGIKKKTSPEVGATLEGKLFTDTEGNTYFYHNGKLETVTQISESIEGPKSSDINGNRSIGETLDSLNTEIYRTQLLYTYEIEAREKQIRLNNDNIPGNIKAIKISPKEILEAYYMLMDFGTAFVQYEKVFFDIKHQKDPYIEIQDYKKASENYWETKRLLENHLADYQYIRQHCVESDYSVSYEDFLDDCGDKNGRLQQIDERTGEIKQSSLQADDINAISNIDALRDYNKVLDHIYSLFEYVQTANGKLVEIKTMKDSQKQSAVLQFRKKELEYIDTDFNGLINTINIFNTKYKTNNLLFYKVSTEETAPLSAQGIIERRMRTLGGISIDGEGKSNGIIDEVMRNFVSLSQY